jgi:hypothetical protein
MKAYGVRYDRNVTHNEARDDLFLVMGNVIPSCRSSLGSFKRFVLSFSEERLDSPVANDNRSSSISGGFSYETCITAFLVSGRSKAMKTPTMTTLHPINIGIQGFRTMRYELAALEMKSAPILATPKRKNINALGI